MDGYVIVKLHNKGVVKEIDYFSNRFQITKAVSHVV